jgi:hypothetical protein
MSDYSQNKIVVQILNKYLREPVSDELLNNIQYDLGGSDICSVYLDNFNTIQVEFKSRMYWNKGPISWDNYQTHNWGYIDGTYYKCRSCNMESVFVKNNVIWADADLSCDEFLVKEIIE